MMKLVRGCVGLDAQFLSLYTARAITHKLAVGILGCIVLNAVCSEFFANTGQLSAQEAAPSEYTEEEQRQIELTERFLSILEKNPRRGTAMDRVFAHHLEFGTLDQFVEDLRERTQTSPVDGVSWMLLGLFESQRGKDVEAVEAFTKAEQLRPQDALAAYYLSQSLLRIGENRKAVEAMERAIACNPPQSDLLEIFQQLGRVHQRSQRTEEALAVWERLETLFPKDSRVLEQIAVTLVEEGQAELALPRYEQLVEAEQDAYRKTSYRITAADLKIKTKGRDAGLQEFEAIMADLNPEGWLFRDVRRRIEDVFLKSNDQDSLVQYYENWIAKHPEDVEAMARVARFLSDAARVPEATQWMEKALQLAPNRSDLRKSFIDQLIEQQKYAEAAKQYEVLCQTDSNNVDYLRDWGKLVFRDRTVALHERQAEATRIWERILDPNATDALLTSQVADLFRNAEIKEKALGLYQKAVELAPGESQYKEYLGQFYHLEKQPEQALKTWATIAAPPNRNTENLARVAEVYSSFGYRQEALDAIVVAVDSTPKEFPLQIRAAQYHSQAAMYDEALQYIGTAEALAESDEQRGTVLQKRIEVLQDSERLDEAIQSERTRIAKLENASADDWFVLARYLEAKRDWVGASEAIESALKLDAKSLTALTTAARITESAGNLSDAAMMYRRLSEADRRSRGDHLTNVARLEAQLGRADEAMDAANQLILAAPGNTVNYEFFAQLCFRLGRDEAALDALRKAIRINPSEPRLTIALASALADQFQNREAIDLYWRAFENSDNVDDKTSLIIKLVPLYEQLNEFDQLVDRLERDRQDENKRRDLTICLAQAYQASNDYGSARSELESLLSEHTRDTELLQQLAKLCQSSGDIEAALDYQRQLVAIAPGPETETPLVALLQGYGFQDEANEIMVNLARRVEDPSRMLRSLDSLLSRGNEAAVLEIIEPLLNSQTKEWELGYRCAVALAKLGRTEEAISEFRRLLSLNLPHATLGRIAAERLKQSGNQTNPSNSSGASPVRPIESAISMIENPYPILQATGSLMHEYYGAAGSSGIWMPDSYAAARMAAYSWLLQLEESSAITKIIPLVSAEAGDLPEAKIRHQQPPIVDETRIVAIQENASNEDIYNWMFLVSLQGESEELFQAAKRLAINGSREEQLFFLRQILRRQNINPGADTGSLDVTSAARPLSNEDIEIVLKIYHQLSATEPKDPSASIGVGQIFYASDGRAYINVGGVYRRIDEQRFGDFYHRAVIQLLRDAGRTEEATKIFEELITSAETASQLAEAVMRLFEAQDWQRLEEYFAKWVERAEQELTTNAAQSNSSISMANYTILRWMGRIAAQQDFEQLEAIASSMFSLRQKYAIKAAKNSPLAASGSNRSVNRIGTYQVPILAYYGESVNQSQMQMIVSPSILDQTSTQVLYQLSLAYSQASNTDQLIEFLSDRVEAAVAEEKIYEQARLATVLWWNGSREEALEILSEMSDEVSDSDFKLLLASLLFQCNRLGAASELIDSITATNQQVLRERELLALQVAERLGNTERAMQAAERLFGMRLDLSTETRLAASMRRLGMNEMASAVAARVTRSSGDNSSSLLSLMSLYKSQGKTEEAIQAAQRIVRQTISSITSLVNSSPSTRVRPSSPSSTKSSSTPRTDAIRFLQQAGKLQQMIEDLKKQIEQYPDVTRSYELLAEYYEAAGFKEEALETLENIVRIRPEAFALRLKLGELYQNEQKFSKACDQYLEVLKVRPEIILTNFPRYSQPFASAKRIDDLITVVQAMNWRQSARSSQVVGLISVIVRSGDLSDATIALLEKAIQEMPEQRLNLLNTLSYNSLMSHPRATKLLLDAVVPSPMEVNRDPWTGLSSAVNLSNNGQASTTITRMLDHMTASEQIQQVLKTLEEGIQRSPDWIGGKALLAIVKLKSGNSSLVASGKEKLLRMSQDQQTIDKMPYVACWILGQTLEELPGQSELAVKFLEASLSKNRSRATEVIRLTPVARLLEIYKSRGEKEKAKALLLSQKASRHSDSNNMTYASSQRLSQNLWLADQMLELDYPAAAIGLLQEVLGDSNSLQMAEPWDSLAGSASLAKAKRELEQALQKIDSSNAQEAINEIFALQTGGKPNTEQFSFLLNFPRPNELENQKISSTLVDVVLSLAKSDAALDAVNAKITELQAQTSNDLSILLISALLQVTIDPDKASDQLDRLIAWADENPLPKIAVNGRWSIKERREADKQIKLWIVARHFMAHPQFRDRARLLAERATKAAGRQYDSQPLTAILFEWAMLASKNEPELAARIWTELLEIATKRPKRRVVTGAKENQSDSLPPLTQSQFDLAMLIANKAADAGLGTVSQTAVREALAGGMPVADAQPIASPTSRQTRSLSASLANRSRPYSSTASPEAKVTATLNQLFEKWHGEQYDADAVMNTIYGFVFPEEVQSELRLYPDSTYLPSGRVSSMGRTLVLMAAKASKLDWLAEQIDSRQNQLPDSLPTVVLKTLIAIEKNDQQLVADSLDQLAKLLEKLSTKNDLELACHALVPAAEYEAYQEQAMPLLASTIRKLEKVELSSTNVVARYSTSTLDNKINSYFAKQGSDSELKKQFEERLQTLRSQFGNYSGNYAVYRQWVELATLANEAAAMNAPRLSIEYLGRAMDMKVDRYANPEITDSMHSSFGMTRAMKPLDAYILWSQWTLPSEQRPTLRIAADWLTPLSVPPAYMKGGKRIELVDRPQVVSNLGFLVNAAGKCDRMAELESSLPQLEKLEVAGRQHLQTLIAISKATAERATDLEREKGAKAVAELFSNSDSVSGATFGLRQKLFLLDIEVFMRAIEADIHFDGTLDKFEQFDARLRAGAAGNLRGLLRERILEKSLEFAKVPMLDQTGQPSENWTAFHAAAPREDAQVPLWFGDADSTTFFGGASGNQFLSFDYPVTGSFEFTADCFLGDQGQCAIGYGGVLVHSQTLEQYLTITSVSGHESFLRKSSLKTDIPSYGQCKIVSDGKNVQFFLNGDKVYEEPLSDSSPWLLLATEGNRVSRFRNLQMRGSPIIPREVNLIANNSMDGWSTSAFKQTQPRHRIMRDRLADENSNFRAIQEDDPTNFDWQVNGGVLLGARSEGDSNDQRWLYYQRPLREGETFAYEYYYVPGSDTVAPTIGQLAMLMESDGIYSHWISNREIEHRWGNLSADNRTLQISRRRGKQLPLKQNDWNKVSLSMGAENLQVTLNDQLVFEVPSSDLVDRRFGLFRFSATESKVRKATLSGAWPEDLETAIKDGWFKWNQSLKPEQRSVIESLIQAELD